MSGELSREFADMAVELLSEDGVAVSVRSQHPAGSMTPSGDRLGAAPARDALGIILPARGTALVDGAEKASERVIMTPVDPWPAPGDRILINGRTLVVADDGAKTYAPQGIAIIHDLSVAS